MIHRPPLFGMITAALFVLLAGGGIYSMMLIGRSTRAAGPPTFVLILTPQSSRTPGSPATPISEVPIVALPFNNWPANAAQVFPAIGDAQVHRPPDDLIDQPPTLTPSLTQTPTATFTATASPTATATATFTFTPTPSATPFVILRPNDLPETYLPQVSDRAREIYQFGLSLGNNPRAFTRLGDCHSAYPGLLGAFDSPTQYRLGDYAYLRGAIDYYSGSFSHDSKTAHSGFHMGSYFLSLWADPQVCYGNETPMDCEYRLTRPSLIFINLGTLNKDSPDEQYESFLRPILDYWIKRGVLPILNTKADNIEGNWRFNAVTRRLAAEYDIPLWDFWIVAQSLPNQGLAEDAVHLSEGVPYFDDPAEMSTGWTLRNLTGLQALDTVWRALSNKK